MILIVSKSVAHLILQEIERTLQTKYAITAFQHEIEVMSHTPASSRS
jgi:hypothetical protein